MGAKPTRGLVTGIVCARFSIPGRVAAECLVPFMGPNVRPWNVNVLKPRLNLVKVVSEM